MIKLPSNISSKYFFVLLAAERAKQLQQGAVPLIETNRVKATYRAMEELMAEKVEFVLTEKETPLLEEDQPLEEEVEETDT